MNQIAFIIGNTVIYWYSLIFALSVCAGVCLMVFCCGAAGIEKQQTAAAIALTLALGAALGRLLYWYCRNDQYTSAVRAFSDPATLNFALSGVFIACGVSALVLCRKREAMAILLDCMAVSLCAGLCIGRLGFFATAADRGTIAQELTSLPFSYPVMNSATGEPEFRIATFLYQSIAAAVLAGFLASLFRKVCRKEAPRGSVVLTFLLVYCAGQVLLDSTRYDSLYFRFNGFVSMVQVFSALTLAAVLVIVSVLAVKRNGQKNIYRGVWGGLAVLFGLAGFMEYYVQRHGRQAMFSYMVMEHCLVGIVLLGLWLMKQGRKKIAD